jgi:hypothetical protein
MLTEKELTSPVHLCQANGRLLPEAVGWSRTPLHTCNLSGRWPRKKRWNYWAVTTDTHLFSVTVSNVDYVGLVFVYVADFINDQFNEMTQIVPLGRGCDLPDTVNADVAFARSGLRVEMRQTGSGVQLAVDVADFEGRPLSAQFTITTPPRHETLNVVIPWNEKTFQFTSKQNTLPAEGVVTFGDETIQFSGEQSFACLDFGRGIWPRHCAWNWGSASGRQNGRSLGLNLGGQWTDGTGLTENGVCVNGRLSKISEELRWQYDKSQFRRPWRITAPSGSVDLTFTPFMERVAASNLWLVKSEVHQMFGHYHGAVQTADGESIPVQNLIGWAEDHTATW